MPALISFPGEPPADKAPRRNTGEAAASESRPAHFPHRFWAACDFEGRTPDYAWFGTPETANLPRYPGNATVLRGSPSKESAAMAGINPVPGPRMGKSNGVYFRYWLKGADTAIVQHFNLTKEDNHHLNVRGLVEGRWAELALDFTRDSRRNDGSPGAMAEGDRMDDLKVFAGKAGQGKPCEILLDDLLFFADDPSLPPDPEPFPNRVILLAAFDTGEKEKYWPGDFQIVDAGAQGDSAAPPGTWWRAARSVSRSDGKGKWIRLGIVPPRPVGERTKLRFRYHLRGATSMIVQIFDVKAMDNRHIRLDGLKTGEWETVHLDFTRDSRRNDGSAGPFEAGSPVDDLFFFVDPQAPEAQLHLDEVVLYDAARPR
jgi:hypothetical protein